MAVAGISPRYEIAQVSPSWDPVAEDIPFADQWNAISSRDGSLASERKPILYLRSRCLEFSGIRYTFDAEYRMNDCVVWKYDHKSSPKPKCMSDCEKMCCVSHAQLIRAAKACVDVRLDIDQYRDFAGKHDWQARASLDGKQVWSTVGPHWSSWETSIMSSEWSRSMWWGRSIMLANVVKNVKEIVSSELTDNNWITTQTKVRYHPRYRHCHPTSRAPSCFPGKWKEAIDSEYPIVIHKKTKCKKCAMPGATGGREQDE